MNDLTNAENVVKFMSESNSSSEWDNRCEEVKRANGGQYPRFWYEAIILPGIAQKTAKTWGTNEDGEIHISLMR